jgi:phospholipid/cholesterol/gamma-HCH transport system permease protein
VTLPSRFDRGVVEGLGPLIEKALKKALAGEKQALVDLSEVETFDSAGMAFLIESLEEAKRLDVDLRFFGVRPSVSEFFSLVGIERLLIPEKKSTRVNFIERIGDMALPVMERLGAGKDLLWEAAHTLADPSSGGKRSGRGRFFLELEHAGIGAIGIVGLIGFLLGLILAMQAWVQLKVFGADKYVADMVAVSITREIGPLMTAILVAARSGSSIAAQLGTMVINEEVDALRQMGINPIRYLVVPKVGALALATPCLAVLFSTVAIFGGLLFGVFVVDLGWQVYIEATSEALQAGDIFGSLFKSTVFGSLVAIVGCTLGLNVKGGPVGVGKATTGAVVASIFMIIVFDAIFVLLLRVGA